MHRVLRLGGALAALLALTANGIGTVAAQQIDSAFSDTLIHGYGYPELTVTVGPDGVEAPAELPAGYHVVTLEAADDFIGYVDIVEVPAGLSQEELEEQALAAGAGDVPQPGWTYVGGTNTPGIGETASFIIDLQPGDYHWAASYYPAEEDLPEGEEFVEVMRVVPFTVVDSGATPAAMAEPPATVTLEETDDLRYLVSPDPVPAGPQLWKIANTGTHHAHHVVMMRVPEGTTAEQIIGEFGAMMGGTPPAGESVMAEAAWVGYAALQSGGQTTWAEFDLEPATYAVICFIIDPATGQPHLVNGMVTVFEVA